MPCTNLHPRKKCMSGEKMLTTAPIINMVIVVIRTGLRPYLSLAG